MSTPDQSTEPCERLSMRLHDIVADVCRKNKIECARIERYRNENEIENAVERALCASIDENSAVETSPAFRCGNCGHVAHALAFEATRFGHIFTQCPNCKTIDDGAINDVEICQFCGDECYRADTHVCSEAGANRAHEQIAAMKKTTKGVQP